MRRKEPCNCSNALPVLLVNVLTDMRLSAAAVCFAILVTPSAQSSPLTGAWSVAAEGAKGTTDEGGSWSMNPVNGTLTLDQKASAVTGTWKGQMPEPWAVEGQIDGATFQLRTEWRETPVTRDGVKSTTKARWVFRGTVSGSDLSGTLALELDGRGDREQRFKAKRTP